MSTPKQNFKKSALENVAVPIDSSTEINQGDLIQIVSNLGEPASDATKAVHGVSVDTNPVASIGDLLTRISVARGGAIFSFLLEGSGSVNYNDSLYLGSDPQSLTNVAPMSGVVIAKARNLVAVVAGAGNSIDAEIVTAD